MRTRITSADEGCTARWRLLMWDTCAPAVVAACFLTSCISVGAQDSKSGEYVKTSAAQQKVQETKDGETGIAHDATSAACKIESDAPPIVTHTSETASPEKSEDREGMSKGSNEPSSVENHLTLRAPAREELTDQIQLDAESATREESQSEKSVNSKTGPELKCTPREAATKTEPVMPN
jgi:hypothetical protein